MMTHTSGWTDSEWVEERTMEAVDEDYEAVEQLSEALAAADVPEVSEWPAEVRESWDACVDLLCDNLSVISLDKLLYNLAGLGYDTRNFRDVLARLIRTEFEDYADPAALIKSLGLHDTGLSMAEISQRWARMRQLRKHAYLYHPAHGAGDIAGVDDLSNEVKINFERPIVLPLSTVLQRCIFVRNGTAFEHALRQAPEKGADGVVAQLRDELPRCFVPPSNDINMIRAFLVPNICDNAEFMQKFGPQADPTANSTLSETQKSSGLSDADLEQSRSLDELLINLREAEPVIHPGEAAQTTLSRLLKDAASDQKKVDNFAEAVARLWDITAADAAPWLKELVRELASTAGVWRDAAKMAAVTTSMKAALANAWLKASANALSAEAYAKLCMRLPLRFLTVAETAHRTNYGEIETWDNEMRRQIRTNMASADLLVSLWRRDGHDALELRDPALVLRTLGKPTQGPYLQAYKTLYKLLMQDEQFQDHLTNDGDEETAPGFIAAVKHSTVLQPGERQSLLVKTVRRHPHLKPYVEHRKAPQKKESAPVTSERSYRLTQKELQSIIREKIPANSKAIAHARSYGDLRENAEYKAAKEEQAYLTSRRNELEESLNKVRPVNFRELEDPDKVAPGVKVEMENAEGNIEYFYVLGLWDSDPDRRIISYHTPLGRQLLGKTVGATIKTPTGKEMRITKITVLPEEILQWQEAEED